MRFDDNPLLTPLIAIALGGYIVFSFYQNDRLLTGRPVIGDHLLVLHEQLNANMLEPSSLCAQETDEVDHAFCDDFHRRSITLIQDPHWFPDYLDVLKQQRRARWQTLLLPYPIALWEAQRVHRVIEQLQLIIVPLFDALDEAKSHELLVAKAIEFPRHQLGWRPLL